MGGMDQIVGVVKFDFGFDVSNCSANVLVAFLRSVAIDLAVKRLILSQSF